MNYLVYTITCSEEEEQEILIAQLSELGFDGFEQQNESLKAFLPSIAETDNLEMINSFLDDYMFQKEILEDKNWNAEWESNFEPIEVEDKVFVRAIFHEPNARFPYELIIQPKMSFGTGHHATTYMMISEMMKLDLKEKRVLDFGAGTGILGILASKLGAKEVLGTEIEVHAVENAIENAGINEVTNCAFIHYDQVPNEGLFDIVLANITKNVITDHYNNLDKIVVNKGYILTSGYYEIDAFYIQNLFENIGYEMVSSQTKNDWVCQAFFKK